MGSTISPSEAGDVLDTDYQGTTPNDDAIIVGNATTPTTSAGPRSTPGDRGPHPGMLDTTTTPKATALPKWAEKLNITQNVWAGLLAQGYTANQIKRMYREELANDDQKKTYEERQEDYTRRQLENTYYKLWGQTAPKATIEQAVRDGVNIYQFEEMQRQDPSFKRTETYQNEYADRAISLAQRLGIIA